MPSQRISREERNLLNRLPSNQAIVLLLGPNRCTLCIRINPRDKMFPMTLRNWHKPSSLRERLALAVSHFKDILIYIGMGMNMAG